MNILQKIFKGYYEVIQYTLHPRDVEMQNIEKMVNCGGPSFGGAMYACSQCGKMKFVPSRCKSRFCPTCGVIYCQERSTSMSFKLLHCHHRHCVFAIDGGLRHFFLKDRPLLDCLFQAVRNVVSQMFYKLNKTGNFVPGFICVLHTFGRPLEWDPHIHCLITGGGFPDRGTWRTVKHFNYTYLPKAFQAVLLNGLEKKTGPSFKKTKALTYRKDKNGFYVYAKPALSNPPTVIKYISRYLGRPVIALSRIGPYGGDNVTFHYNRHEDNVFVQKTLPAIDFIKLPIQHIPEWNFKMARYYGLYARHRADGPSPGSRAVHPSKHANSRSFNRWREMVLLSFGYGPPQCPGCKTKMTFQELYFKHERASLDELYERATAKAKMKASCRSS